MAYFLLMCSIALSTGRNLFSKRLSAVTFGTRVFFLYQSILMFCGGIAILMFGGVRFEQPATVTCVYAIVYGLLLILAQWFYTGALTKGNTGLCSTVYSLGFVLPTLSGAILWAEPFSIADLFGVIFAMAAVVTSGIKSGKKKQKGKTHYFIPLVIAMLASGGLGIVQKIQQKSAFAEQKSLFLFIAFLIASGISIVFTFLGKNTKSSATQPRNIAAASCVGLFFGSCNFLNTTLAGMLDSAIFFPTLNIGVILLSLLSGALIFRERISKKEILILGFGAIAILLLNLG